MGEVGYSETSLRMYGTTWRYVWSRRLNCQRFLIAGRYLELKPTRSIHDVRGISWNKKKTYCNCLPDREQYRTPK